MAKLLWKTFNNPSVLFTNFNSNKLFKNYLITKNYNYIITSNDQYIQYK